MKRSQLSFVRKFVLRPPQKCQMEYSKSHILGFFGKCTRIFENVADLGQIYASWWKSEIRFAQSFGRSSMARAPLIVWALRWLPLSPFRVRRHRTRAASNIIINVAFCVRMVWHGVAWRGMAWLIHTTQIIHPSHLVVYSGSSVYFCTWKNISWIHCVLRRVYEMRNFDFGLNQI